MFLLSGVDLPPEEGTTTMSKLGRLPRSWIASCAVCGAQACTNIPASDAGPAAGYCGAHREEPARAYDAWRSARIASDRAKRKAEAAAFWASKGIQVGAKVRVYGQSLYGRFPIVGTAKAGVGGAYVAARYQGRAVQLDARGAEAV